MQWEEESLLEASVWGEVCGTWGHPRFWLTTNICRAWGWGRRWRTQGENPPGTHCWVLSRSPSFPAETFWGQKLWLGERGGEKRGTLVRGMANKVGRSAQNSLVALCCAPVSKISRGDFWKGFGPARAYRQSVKGFAEIVILTSNVVTKWKTKHAFEWVVDWRAVMSEAYIHYIYMLTSCVYIMFVCVSI